MSGSKKKVVVRKIKKKRKKTVSVDTRVEQRRYLVEDSSV